MTNEEKIKFILGELFDKPAHLAWAKELFAAQRWISVAERMPEDEGEVLVYANAGQRSFIVMAGWLSADRMWWAGGSDLDATVTHWRPLSSPPEKGEG